MLLTQLGRHALAHLCLAQLAFAAKGNQSVDPFPFVASKLRRLG